MINNLPNDCFTILKAGPMSVYGDRIVVNKPDVWLYQRLDMLSMWGGSDKEVFDCPSWEMGSEELAVAVKWCNRLGMKHIAAHT